MNMTRTLLTISESQSFLLVQSGIRDVEAAIFEWNAAGLTARAVRGSKMHTLAGLYDEFAAVFQFPSYFGENWNAFHECLQDMDWLPVKLGLVVVIKDAVGVLDQESTAELTVLTRSLRGAIQAYNGPIHEGQDWDRPALPCHIVLHTDPGNESLMRARWETSGATLSPAMLGEI